MKTAFAIVLTAMVALNARAEMVCDDGETINRCLERSITVGRTGAENKVAVEDSQPGAQSGGEPINSTVTDLIPWLNMLGVLSDSDASDGSIAVDLNFLLGQVEADHNAQLKWVLDVSPEPFAALIDAFPEAVREARKAEIAAKLDETADTELQFSWSLVTERFGRDFRRHHDSMVAIMAPAIQESLRNRNNAARRAYLNAFGDLIADAPFAAALPANVGGLKFNDPLLPAEVREPLKRMVARLGTQLGGEQQPVAVALQSQLAATGLDRLSQLVLQQPQLLFSATRRFRDELVGPDAAGAKITYEHSFANYGAFRRESRNVCDEDQLRVNGDAVPLAQAAKCYAALGRYLEEHAANLENEDRLSLSVEYRKVNSIHLDFPADAITLAVPKTDRLIGSLGYGRSLSRGSAQDRVDFKVDYDSNISGKRGGNSRAVASLTYTRRIAGVDVPFGVVYANKSEYLEGIDKQVSLHVGVKFRAAPAAQ